MLLVRAGRWSGCARSRLKDVRPPDDELCAQFLAEYYAPGSFVPDEVWLPLEVEAMDGLAEMLAELRGKQCQAARTQKGPARRAGTDGP